MEKLPYPVILGYRAQGTACIVTQAGRPNLYYWDPDQTAIPPEDLNIPMLTDSVVSCAANVISHATTPDVVELAPLQRTIVKTDLHGPHWQHFEQGTRLHVINPGDDLTLLGLNLCEAIAELNVDSNTKERSTLIELYNNTDKAVVFPRDSFVARLRPIHTCAKSHCHSPPEYTPEAYIDPYYRFDEGYVFHTDGPVDDPHHFNMTSLHNINIAQLHLAKAPTSRHPAPKVAPPPPPPLPDEDWLKQFSYLPTWTTEQLHLLQKALITQRHEATVWSDNDWDIWTHTEIHHIDEPLAPSQCDFDRTRWLLLSQNCYNFSWRIYARQVC